MCRGPRSVSWRLPAGQFSLFGLFWAHVGFRVMSLTPLAPTIHSSFLPLFSRILWARHNVQLCVSASVSISSWMKALWWQLGETPIYEYNRISLDIITLTFFFYSCIGSFLCLWVSQPQFLKLQAVSVVGLLSSYDSQAGLAIDWPLPLSLYHP